MLLEYYSIRIKDAEPGKGLLHSTAHYDEVRSALKHFKTKHPDKKVVAYKHEIKKGPMGMAHKRKEMFGECTEKDLESEANRLKEVMRLKLAGEYRHEKARIHGKDAVMGESVNDSKDNAMSNVAEATRSFNTLMRSIQDKKSIKNLKVPSPTERRAMEQPETAKPKREPWPSAEQRRTGKAPEVQEATDDTPYHRISVTVSQPNHPMVNKRKDKIQRIIRVKGDKTDAVAKAKAHYKGKGYKVHGAEYLEGYALSVDEAASDSFTTTVHSHTDTKGNTWEVRGEKYPNLRRPRHAIFKNGAYHSMAGTAQDAKGRVQHLAEESLDESIVTKAHDAKISELMGQGYKPHSLGDEGGVGVESNILKHKETGKKIQVKTWRKSISDVGQEVKPIKEETMLSEDVYKVEHEGHPDAEDHPLYKHLPTGKKYTNHITKFPNSAKKHADILKKAGFKGVKVYKNWKLMESVDLEEAYTVKKYDGSPKSVAKGLSLANKSNGSKVRADGTLEFHEKDGNQIHVHSVWSEDGDKTSKYTVKTMSKSLYKKNYGNTMLEEVELEEGRMSELHADISDHMDKHIANYKKVGGAEALMAHAAKATPKIAKMHGIEHKHAEKFVSDYIESKLNEETLDEGFGSKLAAVVNRFKKPKADAMDDVYEKAKAHAAKKYPGYKLASLGRGENGEINYEVMHPKTGVTKEDVIKEETATAEKFLPNQMSKQNIKIGDSVHVGHVMKGGSGYKGVVTAIDLGSNIIHFRSHEKDVFGYHHYRGKLSNATVE